MPDEAEKRRRAAADGRRFDVDTRDTSLTGTASVWGELDVADALDLDAAVTAGPSSSRRSGPRTPSTSGVRRPSGSSPGTSRPSTSTSTRPQTDGVRRRARQVVLYAHLSDAAIIDGRLGELGRLENTRSLITAEQVRRLVRQPRHPGRS